MFFRFRIFGDFYIKKATNIGDIRRTKARSVRLKGVLLDRCLWYNKKYKMVAMARKKDRGTIPEHTAEWSE